MEGWRRGYLILLSRLLIVGGFFYFAPAQAAEQDLVITEIMYNPSGTDTKHEWLELKNLGSNSVTVLGGSASSSWRIFDGSNHTLATSTVVAAGNYLVIAQDTATFLTDYPGFTGLLVQSSALNLVNSTGTVGVRLGSSGPLWSQVDYFNSWGGDGNGKTLEKINLTGDNSKTNWQESLVVGGTPGAVNSQNAAPSSSATPSSDTLTPASPSTQGASANSIVDNQGAYVVGSIVINEFVSDPNDGEDEWVELHNRFPTKVDLTGWRLEDGSEEETPLSGIIPGLGFLVIKNPKGHLNNSGDLIALKDGNGQIINQIVYGKWDSGPNNSHAPAAYNGQSTARFNNGFSGNDNNDFTVTALTTPGAENIISVLADSATKDQAPVLIATSTSIILNEILPNPSGADSLNEFIEIKNITNRAIDLKGYFFKNVASQWSVATSILIAPQGYLAFKRGQTSLMIKNSGPVTIQLFNPQKILLDQVSYEETAEENWAYGRFDAASSTPWLWTTVATPGAANSYVAPNHPPVPSVYWPESAEVGEEITFDASDSSDPDGDQLSYQWSFGDQEEGRGAVITHVYKKPGSHRVKLELGDGQGNRGVWQGAISIVGDTEQSEAELSAKGAGSKKMNQSAGQFTKITGVVTVLPGLLGKQIFYVQGGDGAYQIYSQSKTFPELKVGDRLIAVGFLSQYQQISRLKIKQAADITVLSHGAAVEPALVNTSDLSDDLIGSLVKLGGEAAEPQKSGFYLIDDSGELQIIWHKSNQATGGVKEGDKLSVSGILTADRNGYRLEPRGLADLVMVASGKKSAQAADSQNKKYLELTLGGLGSALAAWVLRSRGALIKTALVSAIGRWPWKKS